MKRVILLAALAPLLGACETTKGSVAGSCGVFERPPYAVKGKTPYDQGVADNFVESGVAGCSWKRPASRPASIDASASRKATAPTVSKRGLLKRIKDRATHPFTAGVAPVVVSPPIAAEPTMHPMIEPPPRPRDPVDELLHPAGAK